MKTKYSIYGKNEYATLEARFDVIECLLQDQAGWSSHILNFAGEYRWGVFFNRLQSWGLFASRIFPASAEKFIAFCYIGNHAFLAYEISREPENMVRITPVHFIPTSFKVLTSIMLSIWFIIPIFLSPLAWKIFKASVSRNSKLYLVPFCHYLYSSLSECER
jgi:hypothetical protein